MQSSTAQVSNANVPDIYAPLAATPIEIDDYFSLGKFGKFFVGKRVASKRIMVFCSSDRANRTFSMLGVRDVPAIEVGAVKEHLRLAIHPNRHVIPGCLVESVLRPGFETPGWAYSGGQL